MLTKIIIRTSIILMLTTVFACTPEEAVLPEQNSKALLASITRNEAEQRNTTDIEIISQDYQPLACIYSPCSEVLPELIQYYRKLANETCTIQWYSVTCCLEQQITNMNGNVKPTSPACYGDITGNTDPLFQPVPKLDVMVLPTACYGNGATLSAVNPKLSGNPAYNEPFYTVKWFKNGHEIGTGALLSDCICGENVSVTVKSNQTVQEGSAVYVAKPCAVDQ